MCQVSWHPLPNLPKSAPRVANTFVSFQANKKGGGTEASCKTDPMSAAVLCLHFDFVLGESSSRLDQSNVPMRSASNWKTSSTLPSDARNATVGGF